MPTRTASRHRTIPINVKVERRRGAAAPTSRSVPRPAPKQAPVPTRPNMTDAWSIEHRRRVMWISVGVGSLVIIIVWISLFSAQITGNTPTFFNDVSRLIRDVQWPWEKTPTPANEQEIRQLEEEVFPQFQ